MDFESFEHSFLLEQFREFHSTVLYYKQEILRRPELVGKPQTGLHGGEDGPPNPDADGAEELDEASLVPLAEGEPLGEGADGAATANDEGRGDGDGADTQAPLTPERVRFELLSLMQRQGQEVIRRGEESEQRRFREIQFVMAIMADEVFLHLNWTGREFWTANMLESGLFRSHNGGELFFQNVEKLLKGRDATRAEVMAVYLLALSLGFCGKYHRDAEGEERLRYYRLQLFANLFHRHPGIGDESHLFPQTYAHTLNNLPAQNLPRLRPWLAALLGVVLGYIAIAHIIWVRESQVVTAAVERVQEVRRQLPGHTK